jgi:hypothetical protein
MTESEWLACTDAAVMLEFVKGKVSHRKLRLLAVACSRHLWRSALCQGQAALDMAELYADGYADEGRREDVTADSGLAYNSVCYFLDVFLGAVLAVETDAAKAASRAVTFDFSGYRQHEWQAFIPLLHHIFGNPFDPRPTPRHFPSMVLQLASALYDGEDCGFALRDALLEAGHAELAEHFREEQVHPKGCWAVDVILGKS